MLQRIGPYTLRRVLGEGGFGIVYLAEQTSPKRLVALKVLRSGVAGSSVLSRFAHEAETLGLLRHPGIAQVYEAGFYDPASGDSLSREAVARGERHGLPFFAMEFVEGRTLTDFAAAHNLGRPERLRLLMQVCEAVQHAHAKGVIHRDLKPANILVDQSGRAKVLDFGVARVTTPDVAARTMQTDVGQMVGTLGYMSPEQIAADPAEIDTRADVYALGATLYELLTGSPPHKVQGKLLHEATRIICDVPPARLSSIDRSLRGDVETIVAKSLEKDKARRYQTATDLAADLGRFLSDEPISARPPSTVYQTIKFAKRNKPLVGGIVASVLLLIGGVFASSYWAVRASLAQQDATAKREEAELAKKDAELQRDSARREAQKAVAVTQFLQNTLTSVDPGQKGRDVRLADVLDDAAKEIDTGFADKPEVAAALRMSLARAYHGLGLGKEALVQIEPAVEAFKGTQGAEGPDTQAAKLDLGRVYRSLSRFDDARAVLQPLLELRERTLGPNAAATLAALDAVIWTYTEEGKLDQAEPLLREHVRRCEAGLGAAAPETLNAKRHLGEMLIEAGRADEAEPLLLGVYEQEVAAGADGTHLSFVREALAQVYRAKGQFAKAIEFSRPNVAQLAERYGPDHPTTLQRNTTFARTLIQGGETAEALALLESTLATQRTKLGSDHFDTLTTAGFLSDAYLNSGRLEEAATLRRQVAEGRARTLGPDHAQTLIGFSNLAFVLTDLKQFDEAEAVLLDLLARRERLYGPEHNEVGVTVSLLGGNALAASDGAKAEPLLRRSLAIRIKNNAPTGLRGYVMTSLAAALLLQGKAADAEPLVREGATLVEADARTPTRNKREAFDRAAKVYDALGRTDEAAAWRAKASAL
ncbi:MAG: tetratricopeptide repeat protein [Phycisphaerales bacterium]